MASTLTTPKIYDVPHFVGKNYEIALNQLIEAFLTSKANPSSENLSSFTSNFLELMQSRADPPLETIWGFAASSYSTLKIEPLDRITAIKDLFQLIVSCSASCGSVKSIALVAPVIHILHKFLLDLKGFQLAPKAEKKVKKEIKSVADSVIGYITVCCNGVEGSNEVLEDFIRPILDSISFWIVDNVDSLRVFFPLLSDDIIAKVSSEEFGMVELAGFVVAEAFLLKVCLKIQEEGVGGKMKDELKSWIVGSITGFRSSHFYVTLASMLLEPVLPVASIMNLEYEDGLRKVLYDALILVEYSFLSPENLNQLPANHVKRVNFTKLMVTNEAIDLVRERQGEKTKAISYLNAFTNSSLPSQLMNWVRSELGSVSINIEPNGSSPRAYLKWMLNIENRGIKIFDDDMAKYRMKLISYNLEEEEIAKREEGKKPDSDLFFYIDNKGNGNEEDEDTNKKMSAAFMAAAHSKESLENGGRKRRTQNGDKSNKVKLVKYNLVDNSAVTRNDDDSDSGSEIENPESDENIENPKSDEEDMEKPESDEDMEVKE